MSGDTIEALARQVENIAMELQKLGQVSGVGNGYRSGSEEGVPSSHAGLVNLIRKRRLARADLFGPDLFADPAWDMLLELYLAHIENRQISISGLCYGAGVPGTTALRWVNNLLREGLITRHKDMSDNRRVWLRLSEPAREKMERYVSETDRAIERLGSTHSNVVSLRPLAPDQRRQSG